MVGIYPINATLMARMHAKEADCDLRTFCLLQNTKDVARQSERIKMESSTDSSPILQGRSNQSVTPFLHEWQNGNVPFSIFVRMMGMTEEELKRCEVRD